MSHIDFTWFELHVRRLEEAEADCDKHEVQVGEKKESSLSLSERIDKPRMRYKHCKPDLSSSYWLWFSGFQGGEQRTSSDDCQWGGEAKPLEKHHRQTEEPEEWAQLSDWHSHLREWPTEQRGFGEWERGETLFIHLPFSSVNVRLYVDICLSRDITWCFHLYIRARWFL